MLSLQDSPAEYMIAMPISDRPIKSTAKMIFILHHPVE